MTRIAEPGMPALGIRRREGPAASMERARERGRSMKIGIQDKEVLIAVSPAALSAYARAEGWTWEAGHSDIHTRDGGSRDYRSREIDCRFPHAH